MSDTCRGDRLEVGGDFSLGGQGRRHRQLRWSQNGKQDLGVGGFMGGLGRGCSKCKGPEAFCCLFCFCEYVRAL